MDFDSNNHAILFLLLIAAILFCGVAKSREEMTDKKSHWVARKSLGPRPEPAPTNLPYTNRYMDGDGYHESY